MSTRKKIKWFSGKSGGKTVKIKWVRIPKIKEEPRKRKNLA